MKDHGMSVSILGPLVVRNSHIGTHIMVWTIRSEA